MRGGGMWGGGVRGGGMRGRGMRGGGMSRGGGGEAGRALGGQGPQVYSPQRARGLEWQDRRGTRRLAPSSPVYGCQHPGCAPPDSPSHAEKGLHKNGPCLGARRAQAQSCAPVFPAVWPQGGRFASLNLSILEIPPSGEAGKIQAARTREVGFFTQFKCR